MLWILLKIFFNDKAILTGSDKLCLPKIVSLIQKLTEVGWYNPKLSGVGRFSPKLSRTSQVLSGG